MHCHWCQSEDCARERGPKTYAEITAKGDEAIVYCKWCQGEECAKDAPARTWGEYLEMERDEATYERAQKYARSMYPMLPVEWEDE